MKKEKYKTIRKWMSGVENCNVDREVLLLVLVNFYFSTLVLVVLLHFNAGKFPEDT